jgi:hypothetical protein
MQEAHRQLAWSVAAAATVLGVYVYVLSVMPPNVFWSPDEGGKFIQLRSIQWSQGLTYSVPYPGRRLDPSHRFYPGSSYGTFPYPQLQPDGTVRFHWGITFAVLSRLMLDSFGVRGLYVLPLLSGWLIAVFAGAMVWRCGSRLGPLAILLAGLATPIFFYSMVFWEHTLATLFGFLAVWLLLESERMSRGQWLTIALCVIIALVLRVELIATLPALAIAWWVSERSSARQPGTAASRLRPWEQLLGREHWLRNVVIAGIALGVLLSALVLLAPRHRGFLLSSPGRMLDTLLRLPQLYNAMVAIMVNSGNSEGPYLNPLWEGLALLILGLCLITPLLKVARLEAVALAIGYVGLAVFSARLAFATQSYRSLHGLFPIAPYMVAAAYAVVGAWKQGHWRLVRLGVFAVFYLLGGVFAVLAFYVNQRGQTIMGLEWGQRYLLTAYPILVVLAVIGLSLYWASARPPWLKSLFTLILVSMMMLGLELQVRGLRTLQLSRHVIASWEAVFWDETPIVTDLWWLPAAVADFYVQQEMYFVRDPDELIEWVHQARAHGVKQFTFGSVAPVSLSEEQRRSAGLRAVFDPPRRRFGLYLMRFELTG